MYLKKVLASVVAVASMTCCVSAMPLSASATTYLKGDVNGDGTVNNADSQSASQFLLGRIGASDGATAERLDVNRNGIIDKDDVTLIRNIILHIDSESTLTSVNATALPSHSAKTYQKYNAVSGAAVGSAYTVSDVGNISTVSSAVIVGDDDRTIDYSNSGVVLLTYTKNGAGYVGTGFVVDEHTILTAAHCVFDTENNVPCSNLKYTMYNSDGTTKGTYSATSYHVPTEYINSASYGSSGYKYDYAAIVVSQDLSDYVNFNIGVARNYVTTTNPLLYVSGYSSEQSQPLSGYMVTGSGYLKANGSGNKINSTSIYYNVDTVKGTSGSPVYIKNSDGSKTLIGINSSENADYSFNLAKRIDTNVLNFVFNNSNLN